MSADIIEAMFGGKDGGSVVESEELRGLKGGFWTRGQEFFDDPPDMKGGKTAKEKKDAADKLAKEKAAKQVGAVGTVIGSALDARAIKEEADQEAALLEFSAGLSETDAAMLERETDVNINRAQKQASIISAEQAANFAASGVLPTGAPLELMAHKAGELQKGVRDVGRVGFAQAERLRTQARLERLRAKIAKRTGRIESETTLLQGGLSLAGGLFS